MTKKKASVAKPAAKPKTRRILTLAQLEAEHACGGQKYLFKTMFGDKVTITKKICEKYFDKFSFGWAAASFLKEATYHTWVSSFAECQEQEIKIRAEHWNNHVNNIISYQSYKELAVQSRQRENKAQAIAFAECYINDGA